MKHHKPKVGDVRVVNAENDKGQEFFMICEITAVDKQGVGRYQIWKGEFATFDAAKAYINMTFKQQGRGEWS